MLQNHVGAVARGETAQDLIMERSIVTVDGEYELVIRVSNQGVDEAGIPGVRVASLSGLLAETDEYGRYHLAAIDVNRFDRGQNFYLKVDPSTLPEGSEFTTANPRTKRITQGLMSRFNFGVRLPAPPAPQRMVSMRIGEFFFDERSDEIRPEYRHLLEEIAEQVETHSQALIQIEGFAGSCPAGQQKPEEFVFSPRFPQLGAQLSATDRAALDRIMAGWDSHTDLSIEVIGHTSSVRIAARNHHIYADNYALSKARAEAVAQYLIEKLGASQESVIAIGRGPDEPVATNDTEEGRALNRRVELRVSGARPAEECGYEAYDAQSLADRRSQRIHDELLDLVGEEKLATLKIESRELPSTFTVAAGAGHAIGHEERRPGDAVPAPGPASQPAVGHGMVASDPTGATTTPDCSVHECRSEQGLIIQTSGQAPGPGIVTASNSEALQANRRATVDGRFTVRLPEGGVLWATEDPATLDPRLAVKGPGAVTVGEDGSMEPVIFSAYTNYAAYIREFQLHVYRETDVDRVDPLVVLTSPPRSLTTFQWDEPSFPGTEQQLTYVLYAIGHDGQRDETVPQGLSLAQWGAWSGAGSDSGQTAEDGQAAPAAISAATVYGQSSLARQNIPIAGSRVRIFGQAIGEGYGLTINGEPLPVDTRDRFAIEYFLPVGTHEFFIELTDPEGEVSEHLLDVDVTGRYMFLAALADITASGTDISGSVEPLSADDAYDDDLRVDGRLAVYLKGKIKGRYLVTAQVDTHEEELSDIFKDLHRKDQDSVFRHLDPDRYYPVYGDDSTTISDTDSQGRMYVRVDWDKSQVLWGNFNTGLTATEFAQYNRSLYGARALYRSVATTELGEARTSVQVFGSEARTVLGHDEFLGTGGSLYYLNETDIVRGSDKTWIEVRDHETGRVLETITLVRGTDYEIDEFNGRIILAQPLMQITRRFETSIVRIGPMDGNDLVLLVDYEYVPAAFDPDNMTAGGRAEQWFGDHIAVGATHVAESRSTDNYLMTGADATLQLGRGTYLKGEFVRSEATQAARLVSEDGGLTFERINPIGAGSREGDAIGIEARVNLQEQGLTDTDWTGAAWWRRIDDNFSSARTDFGVDTKEYGAEFSGVLTDSLRLTGRATFLDQETERKEEHLGLLADYRLSQSGVLSGEVQHAEVKQIGASETSEALLAALRYTHTLTPGLSVYGMAQQTLDHDDGSTINDDLVAVGSQWFVQDHTSLTADFSTGDRSDEVMLSVDHEVREGYEVYGSFTQSTDRTESTKSDQFAVGSRARISNQATLWVENQFTESTEQASVGHVFGLDLTPAAGWNLGLSLQRGELETETGTVDRFASSVGGGFNGERLRWLSKIEYRKDDGAEDSTQWLTTNRLDYTVNEDLRLLSKLNYSDTDNGMDDQQDARFVEGSVGFGYRPVANDRLNLLGKYTYLYDLSGLFQGGGPGVDQKSRVGSLEGLYDLNKTWSVGGKLAQRRGELRDGRGSGDWYESTTGLAVVRGFYHLPKRWDALVEYRWLRNDETDTDRRGFLVGIDRAVGENLKLGVGYNFTDFSDDLTDLDYDANGWFLNIVGQY